ncbi:MAG: NAD(P)H-quinone oxidoreductase [Burkholderiaceae bacterium]
MIPDRMNHIAHGDGGPASVMKIATGPVPVPQPGEVLIRVAYAGVNRPDVAQRAGSYPPPPGASPLLGLEVSGRIVALGDDDETADTGWAIGDEVCALCNGGGYAQYVAVPTGQVLPVPRGLDLLQAAALPENFFTVWTNVIERGRLKAGETFLVHGGSSGIGLTAIQIAKAWGATVYTTVGGDDKARACLAAGADVAIQYKTQDFVTEVAALTGKRGVDVILDMVGGDYIPRNLRSLAMDGRLVQIAFLQGSKAQVDFTTLMTRRLTFTGSTLRPRSAADKAAMARELRAQIWPRIERGEIKPLIHQVFDLADAAAAHALMESSTHIGKIMLKVD